MIIQVLPDSVINQIAAGEIVDRPASIIRELVDNSVDAGATDIAVYISDGGQSLIRVVDNGSGMVREDALLSFERHATSKLRTAQDLLSISTMGFRGEALPSIASVSKLRLVTRTTESPMATELRFEGGKLLGVEDVAGPVGTQIEVLSLFFNTPARKKFMKSARYEELRIKDWLINSSLCRPHIRYRLISDDKETINLPRRSSVSERAQSIFKGNCISFDHSFGPCRISGVLAHPSQAEASPQSLVILINQRVVSDKMVARAAKDGFGGTLKDREFPLGCLHITLPATEVDVNVHPQKSEVRFSNPQAVYQSVRKAVETAVKDFRLPVLTASQVASSEQVLFAQASNNPTATSSYYSRPTPSAALPLFSRPETINGQVALVVSEQPTLYSAEEFKFSALKYVGQIFSCYLLCEFSGRFYVVDMHAAHERINYNRILNSTKTRNITSQKLLLPIEVRLSESAASYFSENASLLEEIGFEISSGDAGKIIVKAVPTMIAEGDIPSLIKDLAAGMRGEGADVSITQRLQQISARVACHASVRSGQSLKELEVYALFAQLDSTEFSSACPHGRPIIVSFSQFEVERWFGRDR